MCKFGQIEIRKVKCSYENMTGKEETDDYKRK